MIRSEFLQLLQHFTQRPVPSTTGRHLYLWLETLDRLVAEAPRGLISTLDLHALCRTLERTPSTDDAARRTLEEGIDKWLARQFPQDDRQRVLAVTGCDLLMRYRVPLRPFVRLASEYRLVVLVAPKEDSLYQPAKPLPAYVRFQPDATFSYIKSQVADEATIGE